MAITPVCTQLSIPECLRNTSSASSSELSCTENTAGLSPTRLPLLGACPNNRKSAVLATSAWGLRNPTSQDVATQRITRTGSYRVGKSLEEELQRG